MAGVAGGGNTRTVHQPNAKNSPERVAGVSRGVRSRCRSADPVPDSRYQERGCPRKILML